MDRRWRAVLGSAEIGGTISVVDAAKYEIVKRIAFAVPGMPAEAIQPVGIAITRDRKLAFAALGPANRVAVIDAQSYEVMRYLLVGQRVWNLAFNPDQTRLYTTNGVSNDISVIDLATLKVIKSIPVGQSPWGVVSRPMTEIPALSVEGLGHSFGPRRVLNQVSFSVASRRFYRVARSQRRRKDDAVLPCHPALSPARRA